MAILSDGRITISVQISDPKLGVSPSANLIADTGAELSVLPNHAFSAWLAGATFGPAVTFQIAGSTVSTLIANGITSQTDVEPHGGGPAMVASSKLGIPIHHIAAGAAPFVAFDGILAMDLFDEFQADPVKDLAAMQSYLAKRV
jgi:hypothetical protein